MSTETNSQMRGDQESKRVANRMAQRKFRRQRKDYIAYLERELELCRATGSEELLQRRGQIEALRSQKAELRSLLCRVTDVLQRICNSEDTTYNHEAPPSNDEWSFQSDNRVLACPDPQGQRVLPHNMPEHSSTEDPLLDNLMELNVSAPASSNEGFQTSDVFQHAIQPLDNDLLYASDLAGTADGDADIASSQLVEILDHGSDVTLNQAYTVVKSPGGKTRVSKSSIPVNHTEVNHEQPSWEEREFALSRLPPVEPESTTDFGSSTLLSECLSLDGVRTMQKSKMDLATNMFLMFKRQGENFLDGYLVPNKIQALSLQDIDQQITTRLATIMARCIESYFYRIPIEYAAMLGAGTWSVWQVTKTTIILPRLIQAGLIPADQPSDQLPHIFRDTTPHWLKPTAIQQSSEYNAIIDCLPWPSVRDKLILFQNSISLDEFIPNMMSRFIPLATVEDRLVSVTEGFPNILPLFCDYEEQKLRNAYYGYIGMWKVSKADGTIPTARASYMVDEILGNDIIN